MLQKQKRINWRPKTSFKKLVEEMMESDLKIMNMTKKILLKNKLQAILIKKVILKNQRALIFTSDKTSISDS